MFAITGITGRVGGTLAHRLLAAGAPVRAVVRDAARAEPWRALGCDIAVAAQGDADALAAAFAGTQGVFLMTAPNFDPEPGFPETRARAAAYVAALRAARPGRAVFLSTVGAQVGEFNLLYNAFLVEQALRSLPVPLAFLRPGWFMENAQWDLSAARTGTLPTLLQPLDHPIPMVATADVGEAAARLLLEPGTWSPGHRVVELEGPRRYSANDIAAGFAAALGHPVRAEAIPRGTWDAMLRAQGMRHPDARMRMVDGFNQGWIDFEAPATVLRGGTPLEKVLATLAR